MCDYSLQSVKTAKAKVGDQLVTRSFGTGTVGFGYADDDGSYYKDATAVCLMPGTEIAFDKPVMTSSKRFSATVAIFRQIDKDKKETHHDALEFPDGKGVKLAHLSVGQQATVLQLPAKPKTEKEAKEQKRLEYTE